MSIVIISTLKVSDILIYIYIHIVRVKCNKCQLPMTPKLINKNKRDMIHTNNDDKRKKPLIERKGDWLCPKCSNLNFAFRLICNRCQSPKFEADSQNQTQTNPLSNNINSNPLMMSPQNQLNPFNTHFTPNNQLNQSNNNTPPFGGMPPLTPPHNQLNLQSQPNLNSLIQQAQTNTPPLGQGLNFMQQFQQVNDVVPPNELTAQESVEVGDVNTNNLLKFQSSSSGEDDDDDNEGVLNGEVVNDDDDDHCEDDPDQLY